MSFSLLSTLSLFLLSIKNDVTLAATLRSPPLSTTKSATVVGHRRLQTAPVTESLSWFIPGGDRFPSRTFNVGDTVTFDWAGFHNVFIHPTGDCTEAGSIEVGRSTGASYTFTAADAGQTLTFACDVGGHCEAGQLIDITVMDAAPSGGGSTTVMFDWFIPGAPFETFDANVGDTVMFNWQGFHNVFIHPTGDCTETGRIAVGTTTGASYTFTEADAGQTLTFACDVGSHCEANQIVNVNVASAAVRNELSWSIRTYEDITMNVGDTLVFNWAGVHNAFIHPSGDCTEAGRIEVGTTTGASYTFTEADAGQTLTFACDIGSHCEAGQFINVMVPAADGMGGGDNNGGGGAPIFCFSSDALVQLQDSEELVAMKDLKVGDSVLVENKNNNKRFERVYTMAHSNHNVEAEFLQFWPSGLEMSKQHLVFVQGQAAPIPASHVKVGHVLVGDVVVERIATVVKKGIYAPFTPSGTIVVNGILASNYVTLQEDNSPFLDSLFGGYFSFHWLCHAFQTLERLFGIVNVMDAKGWSVWSRVSYTFGTWFCTRGPILTAVMGIPLLSVLSILMGIEYIMQSKNLVVMMLMAAVTVAFLRRRAVNKAKVA